MEFEFGWHGSEDQGRVGKNKCCRGFQWRRIRRRFLDLYCMGWKSEGRGGKRLSARETFQLGFYCDIRGNVRQLRELKGTGIRRPLGLRSERRILGVQPVKKRARLSGSRRNHRHLRRRGKECNWWRINHLENVKSKSVKRGG